MVCFQSLQERLLTIARERVRAGIFTERRLARLCGLSQPYMGINILDEPNGNWHT